MKGFIVATFFLVALALSPTASACNLNRRNTDWLGDPGPNGGSTYVHLQPGEAAWTERPTQDC